MNRILRFLIPGFALLLMGIVDASAGGHASLLVIEGKVMVNHGAGFEPVAGVVEVNAGDRILAGEKAKAVLRYANCSIGIKARSVMTVIGNAPCVTNLQGGTYVTEDAFFGAFVPPVIVPAEFAGGFAGLIALNEFLLSAPAAN
jgi:hypothetical protein